MQIVYHALLSLNSGLIKLALFVALRSRKEALVVTDHLLAAPDEKVADVGPECWWNASPNSVRT